MIAFIAMPHEIHTFIKKVKRHIGSKKVVDLYLYNQLKSMGEEVAEYINNGNPNKLPFSLELEDEDQEYVLENFGGHYVSGHTEFSEYVEKQLG